MLLVMCVCVCGGGGGWVGTVFLTPTFFLPTPVVRCRVSGSSLQVTSYRVDWDDDNGVLEVQTLRTTTSTGPNEIQTFTTSATDVDEMQVGVARRRPRPLST
jgi:hypothetical protein